MMLHFKSRRSVILHGLVVLLLFVLQFLLPEYHHLTATRVMVLATFAMGYNVLFGYCGLLSLGHAMFFATGLYAAGLSAYYLDFGVIPAFLTALVAGAVVSALLGAIALRTTGVAFMIVTLMFAQITYLASLYFTGITRGDEGLVLPEGARSFEFLSFHVSLVDPSTRYFCALALLTICMVIIHRLVRGPTGRAMIAIRENEPRTRMLGYNTFLIKWQALIISGTISSAAGAAYALLFAYVGSTFAGIQYSIDALLYTLLGGAGTVLGPILGGFVMFYLVDIFSEYTAAYLLLAGLALILLILYFPKGILGTVRERWIPWLP